MRRGVSIGAADQGGDCAEALRSPVSETAMLTADADADADADIG